MFTLSIALSLAFLAFLTLVALVVTLLDSRRDI